LRSGIILRMRIGIDARALGWAGLGRYTRNLLSSLLEVSSDEFVVFAPRSFGREIAEFPRVKFVPVTSSYYSFQEQTIFLMSLMQENLDLMHFLHFNAPVLYRRPFVVTIHDLTRFFFPAQKNSGQFHQWAYEEVFRSVVLHAQRIITVSEHTRSDLIRYFPQVANKTSVVYEGVDHKMPNGSGDQELLHALTDYLLFVGVWMTHKNIPRLLLSFKKIVENGYCGSLVVTGEGKPHHVDVPRLVKSIGLKDRVILPGKVDDDTLRHLYAGAKAFIFPSLYEGFGFPPLEAMSCGTPVAASRVSSIPEILGDAAAYFDPYSVDDMTNAITHLINDQGMQAELIERGRKRVSEYAWNTCASETLDVYTRTTVPARSGVVV